VEQDSQQQSWDPQALEPVDWSTVTRSPFTRCFLPATTPETFPKAKKKAEAAADVRREELQIRIEDSAGKYVPPPVKTFEELGVLPEYVLDGLRTHGIVAPMPIQAQSLPLVLAGNNVIGLAQTGSGKTLAFLLPACVQIEDQEEVSRYDATPVVLVLAPTRELAVQISEEATKVLKNSHNGRHSGGVWSTCLYGGANKQMQIRSLKGCQIVVATPGRLRDLMSLRHLTLKRVTYFALDEADRMLDLGFQGEVADISGQVRPERQVLFFSATWQQQVQALAGGLCENGETPVRLAVGQRDSLSDEALRARAGITQEVVVIDYPGQWEKQTEEKNKMLEKHLHTVLTSNTENKVLVFVSQKDFADTLCNKLWDKGFAAGAMHGGKGQESRLYTLDTFRKGEIKLLVATDVLGRGIDIPSVSHVVIYEMGTVEDYIHRIGRTARGKDAKGHALVFFEYHWKFPALAAELILVLETANQPVPQDLRRIADEVTAGKRKTTNDKADEWGWWKNKYNYKTSWGGGGGGGGGGWKQNSWNITDKWKSEDQELADHPGNSKAEPQQAKRRKTYEPEANSKRKRRRSSTSTDSSDS